MARKHKGRPLSGVLLLYKEQGESSNRALQQARRLFSAEKAGHGGTLDPFAEGLLPVLFGEATKFGQYILGADKGYRVVIHFGRETTTDDSEGETVIQKPVPVLSQIDWHRVLEHFTGVQTQIPPIFSALKIDGKRAYELARNGEIPTMQVRTVTVSALILADISEQRICLEVYCSKGTYIRALARDIGRYIGSAAFAEHLQRHTVGRFDARHTPLYRLAELEKIKSQGDNPALDAVLLPLESCVAGFPRLLVPAEKIFYIRHGNDVAVDIADGCYALYDREQFFGIGRAKSGRVYPERLCSLN